MTLWDVYQCGDYGVTVLFRLLAERTPEQSISHKRMPHRYDHQKFVASKPYKEWWLIEVHGTFVGAIYLTKQDEVGLFVFREHQGKGYGTEALAKLRSLHPGVRFLANISPTNEAGKAFWQARGFKPLQETYYAEPQ